MLTISFAAPIQVYLVLTTLAFSVQLSSSQFTISFVSLMHQVYLITASSIMLFYLAQSKPYFNYPPYIKITFIKALHLLYLAFQLQSYSALQHYSYQLLLI
jgi:hypothetical protein